jgi:hypothetical protein
MGHSDVESCPAAEECRALVQRIIASKELQRANRLRDFLLYVVDRKLEGSPEQVTEVLIAHRVFRRPANYHPGEDSIVRTEARILRQRLDRYFADEGRGESIVLEIPKGSYVPLFRRREFPPPIPAMPITVKEPKSQLPNQWMWLLVFGCVSLAALGGWSFFAVRTKAPAAAAQKPGYAVGAVELDSSDPRLVNAFQWAKEQALSYAYTGDPVGDWYDSTAGDRYAFCIRDASHQRIGAAVLGLDRYTRNMFRRFAASISSEKSWCAFWDINKDGFPAPIDYTSDRHFWYCLPANFDMMQACYRQFLWTGDRTYFDSVFSAFYDRTVTSYVEAWDPNKNGIMESGPEAGRRGIPSYYEDLPRALVGADLIAAQYRGYLVYAAIQDQKGVQGSLSRKLGQDYRAKAEALRVRFNSDWWNPIQNRYYALMLPNRKFYEGYIADANAYALLFGITEDGRRTDAALDLLEKNRPPFDQTLSYSPEILFHYGRADSAYRVLLGLTDPNFRGRGMPEIAFAALGAVATGLAGISPNAPANTLETLPRLPKAVEWVKLTHLPVLQNEIAVRHQGAHETTLTNQTGPVFRWRACFPAVDNDTTPYILVDGTPLKGTRELRANRQAVVYAEVPVKAGQSRTVQLR